MKASPLKRTLAAAAAVLLALLLIGMSILPAYSAVPEVTQNSGSVTLRVGQQKDLRNFVSYSLDDDEWYLVGKLTWSSADPEVASVSDSGVVTAHKNGVARISATGHDNRSRRIVTNITVGVTPAGTGLSTGVSSNAAITLYQGKQMSLAALFGEETVSWSTRSGEVATVTEGGLVTAKGVGSTTVIATRTLADGSQSEYRIKVQVTALEESARTRRFSFQLPAGSSVDLVRMLYPSLSDFGSIRRDHSYKTSDAEVVSVSGGVIRAKRTGTAKITVSQAGSVTTAETMEFAVTVI